MEEYSEGEGADLEHPPQPAEVDEPVADIEENAPLEEQLQVIQQLKGLFERVGKEEFADDSQLVEILKGIEYLSTIAGNPQKGHDFQSTFHHLHEKLVEMYKILLNANGGNPNMHEMSGKPPKPWEVLDQTEAEWRAQNKMPHEDYSEEPTPESEEEKVQQAMREVSEEGAGEEPPVDSIPNIARMKQFVEDHMNDRAFPVVFQEIVSHKFFPGFRDIYQFFSEDQRPLSDHMTMDEYI